MFGMQGIFNLLLSLEERNSYSFLLQWFAVGPFELLFYLHINFVLPLNKGNQAVNFC